MYLKIKSPTTNPTQAKAELQRMAWFAGRSDEKLGGYMTASDWIRAIQDAEVCEEEDAPEPTANVSIGTVETLATNDEDLGLKIRQLIAKSEATHGEDAAKGPEKAA